MTEDRGDREGRNEIFNAGQQGVQVKNVMLEDFGYEIPIENVPLPSGGVCYPLDSPAHGLETLEIRAMTAREEDILTSKALIKKGTVITHLLQSCLINKSINVDDMLSGDRNAIMISLRITGYGADYNVEVDCPACGQRSQQSFDLCELAIKRLEIPPVAEGANLFEFELPITKKTVRFKFLTGHDEQEILVTNERRRKQGIATDNLVTTRLQHAIVSLAGVTDKNKIGHFIRNMPAKDSLALRRYIDRNEPGIDMQTWMECTACTEQSEVRLPLGASFFWPDT